MDVPVVGAAQAAPQQAPLQVPLPQSGQSPAPQPVLLDAPHGASHGALSPVVAKLFAHDGISKPISLNVSYRVEHDPNIIVTIFTDPTTGEEVAQIPPEVMVQIAQFFDKQSGVTLDRSA